MSICCNAPHVVSDNFSVDTIKHILKKSSRKRYTLIPYVIMLFALTTADVPYE